MKQTNNPNMFDARRILWELVKLNPRDLNAIRFLVNIDNCEINEKRYGNKTQLQNGVIKNGINCVLEDNAGLERE